MFVPSGAGGMVTGGGRNRTWHGILNAIGLNWQLSKGTNSADYQWFRCFIQHRDLHRAPGPALSTGTGIQHQGRRSRRAGQQRYVWGDDDCSVLTDIEGEPVNSRMCTGADSSPDSRVEADNRPVAEHSTAAARYRHRRSNSNSSFRRANPSPRHAIHRRHAIRHHRRAIRRHRHAIRHHRHATRRRRHATRRRRRGAGPGQFRA